MQTRNRIFEDLARVAGGAASTFSGIKEEIEAVARQRLERLLGDLDLVDRDEFEAAKAMAAEARMGQERLEKQVAKLAAEIAEMKGAAAKPAKAKKPAPQAANSAAKSAGKSAAKSKRARTGKSTPARA